MRKQPYVEVKEVKDDASGSLHLHVHFEVLEPALAHFLDVASRIFGVNCSRSKGSALQDVGARDRSFLRT